ncbi:hypothetical protein ACFLXY_11405 [Chloroflexota bacterium]
MKKVKLFEERGETSIFIDAEINNRGDILISGQDLGKAPMEYFGDLDYEYWLTVKRQDKKVVFEALIEHCNQNGITIPSLSQDIDEALLYTINLMFGGRSTAFSDFRAFLDERLIPAEFQSYT